MSNKLLIFMEWLDKKKISDFFFSFKIHISIFLIDLLLLSMEPKVGLIELFGFFFIAIFEFFYLIFLLFRKIFLLFKK